MQQQQQVHQLTLKLAVIEFLHLHNQDQLHGEFLMNKQFIMLSGLPRTGSTLLSAILSQNPLIHAEGNSALCQIMWDVQTSCNNTSSEQLLANNRLETTQKDILSALPYIYYKQVDCPIILDKCRSWTLPSNMEMAKKYFPSPLKVIVMKRKVSDIVKSFAKLRIDNGMQGDVISDLLVPMSEPLMRSVSGIINSGLHSSDEVLYVDYDSLTNNPKETITQIYEFCNLEYYEHDFNNIVLKYKENDSVYGLKGFHDIRPVISPKVNPVTMPKEVELYCDLLDQMMEKTINKK